MQIIELKHPYVNKCPNVDQLFICDNEEGHVNSIESYLSKLAKLSSMNKNIYDESLHKGDGLEVFVEYMIKTGGTDNRIGIYDYQVVPATEDNGTDGYGIGEDGNRATVQVKNRTGNWVLTANNDHLSNFLTSSWSDFGVPIDATKNMLIIHTGLKIDERSKDQMLKNKVRELNRQDLRNMYDNRPEFWKGFIESFRQSRMKIQKEHRVIELREHQKEAIESIKKDENKRGKIILPTGTGKTLIEAQVIVDKIIECEKNGLKHPYIKVNTSRILLCFQLFDEILAHLMRFDIQARFVNYNSGNKDDAEYAKLMRKEGWEYRKIISTTSSDEVWRLYKKCVNDEIPMIVFSTYHSSEKLSHDEIIPQLTIHDEAHNLVSNNFHRSAMLPTKSNLFFTATEKITDSDDDWGMNNEKIFDNLIYTKSAAKLIDMGEMLPPYVHVIRSSDTSKQVDTDYEVMFQSIMEGFEYHNNKINEISYDSEKIGAKVLVVCRGQQDLQELFKTKAYKKFIKDNEEDPDKSEVKIYALSSDFGICINGEFIKSPVTNMKKHQLLKELKNLGYNEQAIIFHVDMIGEGIDVPGITGIMPFRNCEESKLIQNIGRSTRLHPIDRSKFYNGEISPKDRSKWIKPVSWIIIPSYMIDAEGLENRFKTIIERLREKYGYIPQQHTVLDNVRGLSDEPPIDVVNDLTKKKQWFKSGVKSLTHEFDKMNLVKWMLIQEAIESKKQETIKEIMGEEHE